MSRNSNRCHSPIHAPSRPSVPSRLANRIEAVEWPHWPQPSVNSTGFPVKARNFHTKDPVSWNVQHGDIVYSSGSFNSPRYIQRFAMASLRMQIRFSRAEKIFESIYTKGDYVISIADRLLRTPVYEPMLSGDLQLRCGEKQSYRFIVQREAPSVLHLSNPDWRNVTCHNDTAITADFDGVNLNWPKCKVVFMQ